MEEMIDEDWLQDLSADCPFYYQIIEKHSVLEEKDINTHLLLKRCTASLLKGEKMKKKNSRTIMTTSLFSEYTEE